MVKKSNNLLWEWVKAICTVLLVSVLSYKIYSTPFNVTVDFPTLLSLLLALFSVALAALFYFKATETSNTFYDNTYTFTREISELLVKIESGFGERLKHLDEGYSSMRDNLQNYPNLKSEENVEATKNKIKDEKQEIEKVVSERDRIIEELVENSQLQAAEKERVLNKLKEKEEELNEAQSELEKMNRRLVIEKMKKNRASSKSKDRGLIRYTKEHVIDELGIENVINSDPDVITKSFNRLANDLPSGYLRDLERKGYFDDGLTTEGYKFLIDIIL